MNDDELRDALHGLVAPLPPLTALPPDTARRGARRRRTKLAATGGAGALALAGVLALALPSSSSGPERVLPAAPTPTPTAAPSPSTGPTPSPTPTPAASPSAAGVPVAPPEVEPSDRPDPSPDSEPSPSPEGGQAPLRVVLDPEGLGFVTDGASTSRLTFAAADATAVRTAVARALGEPEVVEGPECGPYTLLQHDGLVVVLSGDAFLGWYASGTGLTTGDGVGVGTTLAELRTSYGTLEVAETTLGPEWTAGDLGGFLDGTSEASSVTGVYAGATCFYR